MAYNDSGELPKEQSQYDLGGYSFELKVQNVHEPGEPDVTSVFAICHSPDGTRETVPMDFPAGTTVESWNVEANETEATVYATIKYEDVDLPTCVFKPIQLMAAGTVFAQKINGWTPGAFFNFPAVTYYAGGNDFSHYNALVVSPSPGEAYLEYESGGRGGGGTLAKFTYRNKDVYYYSFSPIGSSAEVLAEPLNTYDPSHGSNIAQTAWMALYGEDAGKTEEVLIARFAIDLREADGGPDGDWDEPGDVGPDPEKYYTLTVSVTGASAGSNNGTPLEAGQVGGYGNGGTGGNGGGGGAGASTVIIWDFATSKADNVVQEATAQGPGTGGHGGKGGKGGDGCILIFY